MSPNISVLIVDDLLETRVNVQKMLQIEADIEVVGQASTGEEAIKIAKQLQPDIILMDINMPGIDGIRASQVISENVRHSQIIIMSVQSDSDYLRRAMLAGARDFLTKPFGGDELVAAIHRIYRLYNKDLLRISQGGKKSSDSPLQIEETMVQITRLSERIKLYTERFTDGYLVDELARLAAGIAHDLRSPLNIILSILTTIKMPIDKTESNYLKRIERRIRYCKWITDNFLGISFNEKTSSMTFNIYQCINDALLLFEGRFSDSLHQHIQVPQHLTANISKDIFQLAIMNLISNAVEAMPAGGTLGIYTSEDKGNNQIQIFVTDTGSGIPSHQVRELFRIGFTTKPAHCGTGLYVARRLMRQQLGDVKLLKTRINKESVFTISIPQKPISLLESLDYSDTQTQLIKLSAELREYQNIPASQSQREDVTSSFEKITFKFAQNLGNELAVIESTVKEIVKQTTDNTFHQALERITQNTAYAQLLVKNLAVIGESPPLNLKKVSLIEVIEDVLVLLDRKMPHELYQIEWDIDLILEEIEADETQLKQVFMNLIRNALDAMPNGGKIIFRLIQKDDKVIIDVCDMGIGITPEDHQKLFRLGFTTKPNGYGIGLFSIMTIISRHNGKISVESKLGKGTTFRIELPCSSVMGHS